MTGISPQEVAERALAASTSDGCIVIVKEATTANVRWAGNTLTTNGLARGRSVSVIATVDGGEGTAAGVVSTSQVDLASIGEIVAKAERAARDAGPAEDAQPLISSSPDAGPWADAPAETSTAVFETFAPALGEALARSRAAGRELFGFAEHDVTTTYLATSTGLRLRHDQPTGKVEVTGKSHDRQPVHVGRHRDARFQRRRRRGARGRDRAPAGLVRPEHRDRGGPLRHDPASRPRRRPADLRLLDHGRPGRPRGSYGLQPARGRDPRR